MMNYEEMSWHEINMAVTCITHNCQGWTVSESNMSFYHCGADGNGWEEVNVVDYSKPENAWPIIFEHGISLKHLPKGVNKYAVEELWVAGRRQYKVFNKNPLLAAMISFLLKME